VLTPGWTPEGQATALRPSRRQVGCDGSAWHPRDARGNENARRWAAADDRSHKSETRISAIADFACKGKREKKALLLSLLTDRRHHDPGALEKSFAELRRAVAVQSVFLRIW